mmetsp:Transcript_6976/g.18089  ORF Transcript_6976/g.18089 Transcript_6976/m.18089 type:complete len:297 (-) Transcript_6976:1316-2206(-)
MGERKVLNKYYPPDFDPSKLPRAKRREDKTEEVRFMLPFTVRCSTCGEFMHVGKKFNARKSLVADKDYLGIKIYRFFLKCNTCSSPYTIMTDPERADYRCETGAVRNFDPYKEGVDGAEEEKALKDTEEMDAMEALEHKTMAMKDEMDALDELDEIRNARAQQARISMDKMLEKYVEPKEGAEVDDAEFGAFEESAKDAFRSKSGAVKRLREDDVDVLGNGGEMKGGIDEGFGSGKQDVRGEKKPKGPSASLIIKKRLVNVTKKKVEKEQASKVKPAAQSAALSSLAGYGDSSDSS